jgi:hypothetical protein
VACLVQSLTLVLGPETLLDLVITYLWLNTNCRWCLSVWNSFLSENSGLLKYYVVPIDKYVPIDTASSPRIYASSSTQFSHSLYDNNYSPSSSEASSWSNYCLLFFSRASEICARLYLNHNCTSVRSTIHPSSRSTLTSPPNHHIHFMHFHPLWK